MQGCIPPVVPGDERRIPDHHGTRGTTVPVPLTAETLAEEVCLRRARSGERAAFDRLFERYRAEVCSVLSRLLDADGDQIEEAVGVVFLSAFQALPHFRGEAAFATWLHSIAANEARGRRRRRELLRQREAPLSLAAEEELMDTEAPGPEQQCVLSEEARYLMRAVHALPEPYRTPVTLHCLERVPAAEIAQQLGRPAGTVRYQISRGLRLLRERLERSRSE
jgi:RNA polymerase sigma-70 factor (ECF subfamily)